ncbi:MAG TPA: hypothetical protein RMH99_29835 [Sandaracinaceae bacterium LLY-WYZ-13_1]|nr:hypothetical protein [Sandaracinaceae bacterium LLY-WYZ-13_1]
MRMQVGAMALLAAGGALGCTPVVAAGRIVSADVPPRGSLVIVRGVDGSGEGVEVSDVEGAALVETLASVGDARLACDPTPRCGEIRVYDDGRFTVERGQPGPFVLHVERAGLSPVEVEVQSEEAYLLVVMPIRERSR